MYRFSLLLLILSAGIAQANPRYPDIMPVDQVKAGMKGYGLTVFRGSKIERFDVTIVGVVKKGSLLVPGHDMILVKLAGGPMTTRGANVIKGMSGSPIFINGKIIGAFSQGEPMSKEPLGGVTPIEDMLEAWDPKLPQSPTASLPGVFRSSGVQVLRSSGVRVANLAEPIQVGSRMISRVLYNAPASAKLRSHDDVAVLQPCNGVVTVSTRSAAALKKLKALCEPYGIDVAQGAAGGGQAAGFKGAPMVPGAAFSMLFLTGDISMPATGTLTYRLGNRVLGMGHSIFGLGPLAAPLSSAYIYDVYPLLVASYKISSPGPVVGVSQQDRNFSVSGTIGVMPKTIPITVDVRDLDTGRSRVFHVQAVIHPNLSSGLVSMAVSGAVAEIRNTPGAVMARLSTSVDAEEIGRVSRTNTVFDMRGIDDASTQDLDDLLGIFSSNPFYPVAVKDVAVKVEMWSAHKTAQIERIFLKEGRFEPGETAELGIVIKPYKQPAVTKTVKITIPANTPTGRYVLQVKGGSAPAISFGGVSIRLPQSSGTEQAPPASIRQMVERYNEREKNNEIVARMILPTTSVAVEGEKLTNLPPHLDAIMRSAKSSGVKLDRDEVKVVEPTDWVISGQQLLSINVQKKETKDNSGQAGGSTGFPGGGASAGASTPVFVPRELDDEAGVVNSNSQFDNSQFPISVAANQDAASRVPTKPNYEGGQRAGSVVKGASSVVKEGTSPQAERTQQAASLRNPTNPAPAAAESDANEKPVVRAAHVWHQTSKADFATGTPSGVSVTSSGDLILAPTLKKVDTTGESFLWSLVSGDDGVVYAGTGTQGAILARSKDGKLTQIARLPEVSVHSLVRDSSGKLIAGTGPHGKVYSVDPQSHAFKLVLETGTRYVLCATAAKAGERNVYVGTSGPGEIFRIDPQGKTSLFFKTPEEHVLAIDTDSEGNVYAGTGPSGLVYRITPDGKGTVLYDSPEQTISALTVTKAGIVYAATAPKGTLTRIDQNGVAKTVLDRSPAGFTALCASPQGSAVFAAAGNTIQLIGADDTVTTLENRSDVDFLSLALVDVHTLFAGTGNSGDLYSAFTLGDKLQGSFESAVHDAKQIARWGSATFTAQVPEGCSVKLETRSGNSLEPDSTWSSWTAPQSGTGRVSSPAARFIQYRLSFTSGWKDLSPKLRDVTITYLPHNQSPKVAFQAPAGGERWARNQTIRWDGSDPDKDTLTYEVYYSSDNGKSWKALPAAAAANPSPAAPAKTPSVLPATPIVTRPDANTTVVVRRSTLDEVKAILDANPDVPAAMREEILKQTQELQGTPQPVATIPSAAAAQPTTIRETNRSLDTKLLADGVYRLKVIVSDRPSNGAEAMSAESISEPFTVCNSAPMTILFKRETTVNPDSTVSIAGVAMQNLIGISAVQYRVDSGEWIAATPADGIFDGQTESFTLTTQPLSKGIHSIEVKSFNSANLASTEKTAVEIK